MSPPATTGQHPRSFCRVDLASIRTSRVYCLPVLVCGLRLCTCWEHTMFHATFICRWLIFERHLPVKKPAI